MQRHIYDNNRCKTRAVKCPEEKRKSCTTEKRGIFFFCAKQTRGLPRRKRICLPRTCVLEQAACGAVILKMSKMHKFVLICKNASRREIIKFSTYSHLNYRKMGKNRMIQQSYPHYPHKNMCFW